MRFKFKNYPKIIIAAVAIILVISSVSIYFILSSNNSSSEPTKVAYEHSVVNDEGDGVTENTRRIFGEDVSSSLAFTPTKSFTITEIKCNIADIYDIGSTAKLDVYIVADDVPDNSFGEGTKIKTGFNPPLVRGWMTIPLDTPFKVTKSINYVIDFITTDHTSHPNWDVYTDTSAPSVKYSWIWNAYGNYYDYKEYADVILVGWRYA